MPDIIPPTSERINLEKLRLDIPKFYTSRAFTDTTKKWWKDFFEDKDGWFASREKLSVWLLDEVVAIKRRQVPQGLDSQTEQPVQGTEQERTAVHGLPQRPANAPKDVEDMVLGQLSEIPQVSKSSNCSRGLNTKVPLPQEPFISLLLDIWIYTRYDC